MPSLLAAFAAQRDAPSFGVCLFLDSCTDDSRTIVDALAPTLPYPIVTACSEGVAPPNAGRARAAAVALALSCSPATLLCTDADSEPAPDWVAANVFALDRADMVAGRILLGKQAHAPVQQRLIAYYDRLHRHRRRLDPVAWEDAATHHWTSAASLAMRTDTYRTLGGFAPLARGEDADLADRAWRAGYRLRRDARAQVGTSARRHGRAEGGLAASLSVLDETSVLPRVSHPGDEVWRYRHHAAARRSFAGGDVRSLAAPLRLDRADIDRVAAEVPNADAFAARIVGTPPGGMRQVSLAQAEFALDAMDAETLRGAA